MVNLSKNVTKSEIEHLVKKYAEFDDIVVPKDRLGVNRGYAFVYLKKAEDVERIIDSIDGKRIRN